MLSRKTTQQVLLAVSLLFVAESINAAAAPAPTTCKRKISAAWGRFKAKYKPYAYEFRRVTTMAELMRGTARRIDGLVARFQVAQANPDDMVGESYMGFDNRKLNGRTVRAFEALRDNSACFWGENYLTRHTTRIYRENQLILQHGVSRLDTDGALVECFYLFDNEIHPTGFTHSAGLVLEWERDVTPARAMLRRAERDETPTLFSLRPFTQTINGQDATFWRLHAYEANERTLSAYHLDVHIERRFIKAEAPTGVSGTRV